MIDTQQIAYERASFARDVEYLQQMAEDAIIQESMVALDQFHKGTIGIFESEDTDDPEILEVIDQIPSENKEKEEVERMLSSKKDMNIDDIIGISDDEDDDLDAALDLAEDDLLDNNEE